MRLVHNGAEKGVFTLRKNNDGKLPIHLKTPRAEHTNFLRPVTAAARSIYQHFVLETILRRKPLPSSKDGRHIRLPPCHEKPLIDERRGGPYLSNSIRSSRYTIYDFVPKQIVFQATRLSNFYFIVIGIPQAIPGFSTTGNYTTILPLVFFMLLTILKEGYDDLRRHRLDKGENKSTAIVLGDSSIPQSVGTHCWSFPREVLYHLLRPMKRSIHCPQLHDDDRHGDFHWKTVKWQDIRVGDVLKLARDEPIPADVVLLAADSEESIAYIETMALDGETSLKSRQAPRSLRACSTIAGIQSCRATIITEDPNRDLYNFEGRVSLDDHNTIPLTINEVIFRGSVLRNTRSVVALVVNTGEECKIRMNANHHPQAKKPRLERYSNQVVLTLIFYVIMLSVGCSIGYLLWQAKTERASWYISDAAVEFKQIIIGYGIMYNNVIPLALYVSLEIVKIGQMLLVSSDINMFDDESGTPMRCNTNTILENLGQVGFILSDKTGTLTDNVMKFRAMTVGGLVWRHGNGKQAEQTQFDHTEQSGHVRDHLPEKGYGEEKLSVEVVEFAAPEQTKSYLPTSSKRTSLHRERPHEPEPDTSQLVDLIRSHPDSPLAHKAREFLLGMALCHTCLPDVGESSTADFQASSPDELALVRAAKELGFELTQRTSQSISLLVTSPTGTVEKVEYDILDTIEFSSKRKRMSIILRCPDGRIWLLCKGADSALIPRLRQAGLASRKSRDVKRSTDLERERRRRSVQIERRSLVADRPSLAIERIRRSVDARSPLRHSFHGETSQSWSPMRSPVPQGDLSNDMRRLEDKLAKLLRGEENVFGRCFRHLDEFATDGLRTLMFAHKYVTEADYAAWRALYSKASTSLADRQENIEAVGDMIEQSLEILGASAIEDKLQAGVPDTIDKLRRANIRLWMLTGDKRETAINIAHSARICRPESNVFIIDANKGPVESQLHAMLDEMRMERVHSVAVIDGQTLSVVEENPALRDLSFAMIPYVDSVICCRASPAQKADIVKAIPKYVPQALTLAIGDGANDIAMIQAAHVGVGISGKEGLQAARVADYSIAQFRFLQRLLLVHGRWNYVRTAKFVLWTFWKEMFFYMMQALYQRHNGYSGSSLYENWSLTALNTLFTSLCVILPGMFEQDLRAETLLAVPELYVYGQRNRGLNLLGYLVWMIGATVDGFIVWYVPLAVYGRNNSMSDNGTFALGDLMFTLAIVWTNWKLLLIETHYKSKIIIIGFVITVGGWWVWNAFLAGVYSNNISPFDVKGAFFYTFGRDPVWWLTLILTITVLALVELIFKAARRVLVVEGRWPPWKRKVEVRAQERELEAWQELEKDPNFLQKLSGVAEEEDEAEDGHDAVLSPSQPPYHDIVADNDGARVEQGTAIEMKPRVHVSERVLSND